MAGTTDIMVVTDHTVMVDVITAVMDVLLNQSQSQKQLLMLKPSQATPDIPHL
jgi:hypothetical protein